MRREPFALRSSYLVNELTDELSITMVKRLKTAMAWRSGRGNEWGLHFFGKADGSRVVPLFLMNDSGNKVRVYLVVAFMENQIATCAERDD